MQKFDVYRIGSDLYVIVQAEHLLRLNTVILLPILPAEEQPVLTKLTCEVKIDDKSYRINAHMPLTVNAQQIRHMTPIHRLTAEEGQAVMDSLYTIFWGL